MVGNSFRRWFSASILSAAIFVAAVGPVAAYPAPVTPGGDGVIYVKGSQPLPQDEQAEDRLRALDLAFTTRRTAGDLPLSSEEAGQERAAAAGEADSIRRGGSSSGPATFNTPWIANGPDPIVQVQRSDGAFAAESGRIGALAIGHNHQFILGAAQGGIWTYNATTKKWTARTDNLPSLAIGALAVAPSNDMVVYAGTGEGALSGDSYFGNGVLKSTNGGFSWSHVSGDYFAGVAISRLAVDPTNASHLYASVLRGRGGAKRVSPPDHSRFGVWESTNGGVTWTLRKEVTTTLGATDVRMDPLNHNILYASFWGDAIYKSTNGGATWNTIMTGLPAADYSLTASRFALSISHPSGQSPVLYTGFDWAAGPLAADYHPSRIFKSTNEGASWTITAAGSGLDTVADYCGQQCYYDNVIEADPTNPNVLFVAGQFGYGMSPPSGGVFRTDDGGATWRNLGFDMHPDFHALAFDPADTKHVLIGNDGGVYFSANRGGRPNAADGLSLVDWENLNGFQDPLTGAWIGTGLQIAQFSSIATNPTRPVRVWGGTQDNGTLRHFNASNAYYDISSGDGGQVLVDPTDWNYVYGNYFGISPWRVTDGGGTIFGNRYIRTGINRRDRSDFYPPFVLNRDNPSQLFFGTYRLYRTDNSKAAKAADVTWRAISPDLTSGCPGTAPNGARNCTLSAIGVGGGTGVYTGSLDGFVYFSADAQVNNTPTWTLLGSSGQDGEQDGEDNSDGKLPRRPVGSIAVDRSNYRIAYVAYNGFNAATPHRPGHVFKTTDAGQSWTDVSGNLPDSPVNSVVLDPAYPNTLYAGTDVGPFMTRNGGATWTSLGTGFPLVAIWQLDLDTAHRMIAAGTHGRGTFKITDTSAPSPALVLSKVDAGIPVGPGSNLSYTIKVKNIGNAPATGVRITDQIPDNTSFVSAESGGVLNDDDIVSWSGLTVPVGGSVSVHLTVRIDPELDPEIKSIVNDHFRSTSAQGPFASGSPTVTTIAPPFALTIRPASQIDGARQGKSATYMVTITNRGFTTDHYNMSASGAGTFPVTFYSDAACTVATTSTANAIAGATVNVCVKVAVPTTGTGTSTSTITASSAGSPTISASAAVSTVAVTTDTLLVKNDGNAPAGLQAYYATALTANGLPYMLWDIDANPSIGQGFFLSFKHIVWYTGNSYPAPIAPYEAKLQAFLDGGGHLFMSGQDILDQSGGKTDFVKNYLHISWDGTEAQNDIATAKVHGVATTLTAGVGDVPIDMSVLASAPFMDQITPNGTAVGIFTDDAGKTDALSFNGTYKVVFLAFPFEAYGTATQKAELMKRVMKTFFGA
jgi:uncharacterized repeat protein (TIGR01451 family)